MKKKISIIVPVYRVEKYLVRCVESIMQQTYENIEIILVDDGSPDSCPGLCDELALRDMRIIVIHKENGGLSSARNAGLEIASGEYIGFVDSDDYIEPDMYEKLYNAMQTDGSDMCICSIRYINAAGDLINNKPPHIINRERLDREHAFEKIGTHWAYITVINKLYKKKVFDSIRFPVGKLYEDEFTVHHIFEQCNYISLIEDALYIYVRTPSSITQSGFNIKRLDGAYAYLDRYHFFRDRNKPELAHTALRGAYGILATMIIRRGYWPYRHEYNVLLRQVVPNLLRYGDLRVVRLIWVCIRNISAKKHKG